MKVGFSGVTKLKVVSNDNIAEMIPAATKPGINITKVPDKISKILSIILLF